MRKEKEKTSEKSQKTIFINECSCVTKNHYTASNNIDMRRRSMQRLKYVRGKFLNNYFEQIIPLNLSIVTIVVDKKYIYIYLFYTRFGIWTKDCYASISNIFSKWVNETSSNVKV